ncbi:hypothetical protein [Palleronia caenipelagi]|uniref:Uncharacterized protein n=1 Tax=Palleronia caenipelagi TaxID=2489174 RepID=A0A547Q842_9RHOB|nr:hypothetical protein [Palleronia caenipelagi]TRD22548.1 hypothetical protein FEV53_03795 [Palleronia caenipelagi]
MDNAVNDDIELLEHHLKVAHTAFEQGFKALEKASSELAKIRSAIRQVNIGSLPPCSVPVTEHRRQHKSGRPSKINNDPELQAFILARIDRMTFVELASAVADHFPPSRRVGKSAIHAWYRRQARD